MMFLCSTLSNNPNIFRFFGRTSFGLLGLLFFFGFMLSFWENDDRLSTEQIHETRLNEASIINLLEKHSEDSDSIIHQERVWKQQGSPQIFEMEYDVEVDEVFHQLDQRRSVEVNLQQVAYDEDYWKQVYSKIYASHLDGLASLKDSLSDLREMHNMDRIEFAHAVVSLVQDMPYWYILEFRSCNDKSLDPKFECLDGIKYGLLSPSEMAATAVGDCDTRALLLYTLLRHFNYNPIIIVSKVYGHAMLALDLPSTGTYLEHRGRKFYFWETTASGWPLGVIPPGMDVVSYWHVALTYDAI